MKKFNHAIKMLLKYKDHKLFYDNKNKRWLVSVKDLSTHGNELINIKRKQ